MGPDLVLMAQNIKLKETVNIVEMTSQGNLWVHGGLRKIARFRN